MIPGAIAKMAEHKLDMQVGLLKHLGDVATVLLDLVCLSLFCFFMLFQTDWMMMRSLCGALVVLRLLVQTQI